MMTNMSMSKVAITLQPFTKAFLYIYIYKYQYVICGNAEPLSLPLLWACVQMDSLL
jgi:hypothetical protein